MEDEEEEEEESVKCRMRGEGDKTLLPRDDRTDVDCGDGENDIERVSRTLVVGMSQKESKVFFFVREKKKFFFF